MVTHTQSSLNISATYYLHFLDLIAMLRTNANEFFMFTWLSYNAHTYCLLNQNVIKESWLAMLVNSWEESQKCMKYTKRYN